MITLNRNRLSFTLSVLLGIGLAVQTYQVHQLNHKLSRLETAAGQFADAADPWSPASPGTAAPRAALSAGDPFAGLRQMQQQMDALFGSPFDGGAGPWLSQSLAGSPDIRLQETDEEYQVVVGIPDNSELELSTDIEDNTVRLSGSIVYDTSDGSDGVSSRMRGRSQFSRAIPLARPVNPLAMHTERDSHGIVITVPKA